MLNGLMSKLRGGLQGPPSFSLIHTTKRLQGGGWIEAARRWMAAAANPLDVEYVLSIDAEDFKGAASEGPHCLAPAVPVVDLTGGPLWRVEESAAGPGFEFRLAINDGRPCPVDGWNAAAAASRGKFLITVSDDWAPIPRWDAALLGVIPSLDGQYVVWVSTGGNSRVMTFSMLTRAYYERYGYVFYPEYVGMLADDDFTLTAQIDGVIIDCRESLPVFQHFHPAYGTAQNDAVYARQNRPEAWRVGYEVLRRRHNCRPINAPQGRILAVCLPGENFSSHFLCAWTELLPHLMAKGFTVAPCFNHTSNVYITRAALCKSLLDLPELPELVLWLDDDQILRREGFDRLLADLEGLPEADMIAAWTWIQGDDGQVTRVSAGIYTDSGADVRHIPIAELRQAEGLIEVKWTGFPAVLMRGETLRKAANAARERNGIPNPFCPIPAPASAWGHTGEDIAFCVNVGDAGGRMFVDPKVFVEHLKLRAVSERVTVTAEKGSTVERSMEVAHAG
jgi:hypothetical protein